MNMSPPITAGAREAILATITENPAATTKEIRVVLEASNWFGGKPATEGHLSYVVTGLRKQAGVNRFPRKGKKTGKGKTTPLPQAVKQAAVPQRVAATPVRFCPCCGTNIESVDMALQIVGQTGR